MSRPCSDGGSAESEIDATLALFEEIEQVTYDPAGRTQLPSMLRRLNLHVFLNFAAGVKRKQRAVRVLAEGLITTGDAELPIRPYGGDKDGKGRSAANRQGLTKRWLHECWGTEVCGSFVAFALLARSEAECRLQLDFVRRACYSGLIARMPGGSQRGQRISPSPLIAHPAAASDG